MNKSHRKTIAIYSFLPLAGFAAACSGAPDPADAVATSEEAIAESACATIAIPASQKTLAPVCAQSVKLSSSDANYGNAQCTNGFIGEFLTNTASLSGYYPFSFTPVWTDAPLTPQNCGQAQMVLYAWEQVSPPAGTPYWVAKGTAWVKGSWVNQKCTFIAASPSYPTAVAMSPKAGQYSTNTRAVANATIGNVKVRVGIQALGNACGPR